MSKGNPLKPDPKSRKVLKDLSEKGILRREKVGIRNIMHAGTGVLEPVGYSHYWFRGSSERLPSFHPNAPRVAAWMDYNKQRAEITATYGHKDWSSSAYDLSSIFPANSLADMLLQQPGMRSGSDMAAKVSCNGDAILVIDAQMYWTFSNSKADAEEIELFDAMLSTPRQILMPRKNHTRS
jgi:hypothetical protein